MPVVTVVAHDHAAIGELLVALADAVAGALDLGRRDVIAIHVPSGRSAVSLTGAVADASTWPIVLIHGSRREGEKMEAARLCAESAVRGWADSNDVACEGVWAQWLSPS